MICSQFKLVDQIKESTTKCCKAASIRSLVQIKLLFEFHKMLILQSRGDFQRRQTFSFYSSFPDPVWNWKSMSMNQVGWNTSMFDIKIFQENYVDQKIKKMSVHKGVVSLLDHLQIFHFSKNNFLGTFWQPRRHKWIGWWEDIK